MLLSLITVPLTALRRPVMCEGSARSQCTPEWVMVLYGALRDSGRPATPVARFPVYSKTPETVSGFKCYTSGQLT